jgi:tRNA/tmRNA/rRNA uracil-C5-methylase (TrmA/RlmC/RlmD family)
MIELLKKSWKAVTYIAGGIAILVGLLSFLDRFATTSDIMQTKELIAKDLQQMDLKVAQAIDNVNKSVQYQFNANRYATLSDQAMQLKLLLKKSPKDKELQEELKRVLEEKDKAIKALQK